MPNTPRPKRPSASDAELTALSAITPTDIDRAKAAWEADAPPPFRRLLDAKDDGSSETIPPIPETKPAPGGTNGGAGGTGA